MQARQRDDALTAVRSEGRLRVAAVALARLEGAHTVAQVVRAGAEAVCDLGFDRSIVSRVDHARWITEQVHVTEDPAWAAQIRDVGRAAPQPLLPGIPEHDMVCRSRPVLVPDVQRRGAGQVHEPVARASRSRSYVGAPITSGGVVVGFLHADHYLAGSDVTEVDRDLLGVFALGFGFALGQAMLWERMERLRESLDSAARPLDEPWADLPVARGVATIPVDDDARLTRREVEVLRAMGAGETNARIAQRLFISEGTVKSHVKHVLRKLGAANRAEAVARWHERTPPQR